jgi:hypothetical protein
MMVNDLIATAAHLTSSDLRRCVGTELASISNKQEEGFTKLDVGRRNGWSAWSQQSSERRAAIRDLAPAGSVARDQRRLPYRG